MPHKFCIRSLRGGNSSMSQTIHEDFERGNDADGYPDRPTSTPNQPPQSSHEEINYGDGSWPLYAMYSKFAHEEDNRIAELRQKSADGILIFSGLFSATVAALLSVSIQDLKPNSQDNSAFYLANIYEIFANPNASDRPIPPTLVKPPAFSPPGYVIWVNSLWLLSLLISLTGALSATIQARWSLRYLMITQSKDYSPEMRARIHATMSKSEYGRFFFRDSSTILLCLHLSLFLFMAGVLVYFFKINNAIFYALVWWIPIIIIPYAFLTVAPIFHLDMLWYTPFSPLALRVYLGFPYALFQVRSWIKHVRGIFDYARKHYHWHDLRDRYSEGFFEGRTKSAREAASRQSSTIDTEVLEMTLRVLDEDRALGTFFDAIPGFCDSKLVQKPLDPRFKAKLQQSLNGFLDRTFSSHLLTESIRSNRLITCLNAAHSALGPGAVSQILGGFFNGHRDKALESVEIGHCLKRWGHSGDNPIVPNVRRIIACIIARAKDHNDRWTTLIKEVFGDPDRVFQDNLRHGDNVLLAAVIHIARGALHIGHVERDVLESLSQFNMRNTVAELRHEFCALWNEILQDARSVGVSGTATQTLAGIRHVFAALHRGTDSAPIRFSASSDQIDDLDAILSQPSSYPSCNDPRHRPDPSLSITSPSVPPRTQLRDSPIASPRPALVSQPPLATFPHPATEHAVPISDDAEPIRGTRGGPARGQVEEDRATPPPAVIGPLPTPIPSPALSSQLPVSSRMDSAVSQIHYVPLTHEGVHSPVPREDNGQPPPGGATGL